MDRQRLSAIAHRGFKYCNPVSAIELESTLPKLGLGPSSRILDIGCGKSELLIQIATRYGSRCLGIDNSPLMLAEARQAVAERGVQNLVELREAEALKLQPEPRSNDLSICIGSSHALGGYTEALRHLARWTRAEGWIWIAEGYWKKPPAKEYLEFLGDSEDAFLTHEGNQKLALAAGLEFVYSHTTSDTDWDAYEIPYARAVEDFARDNPMEPGIKSALERIRGWHQAYRKWGRETLGFGVYLYRTPN